MANYVNIIDGMTNGTDDDLLTFQTSHLLQGGVVNNAKYSNSFQVTATGTPDKNSNTGTGICYVADGASPDKFVSVTKNASEAKLHDNTTANPRYDTVVLFVDFSVFSDADGSNLASIQIVKGAEAASPSVLSDASITASLGASTWVRLANVLISFPFVSIVSGNISDTRPTAYINANKVAQVDGSTYFFGPKSGINFRTYSNDGTKYTQLQTQSANGDADWTLGTAGAAYDFYNSAGLHAFTVDTTSTYFGARTGYTMRVYESANVKYGQMYHDGTNTIINSNSTAGNLYLIPNGGTVELRTGKTLRVNDNANANYVIISYDVDGGHIAVSDGYLYLGGDPTALGVQCTNNFEPSFDNYFDLGSASFRWNDVWAINATIQTSDINDKDEIQNSDLGLDFISQLRPVSYKWKDTENRKFTRRHYGIIAQELEEVLNGKDFAGFINDNDTGKKGIRYTELFAPIIKSIQELKEQVEAIS